MDSYGPDESKLIGATMLASTLMLGTIFGYIVLSVKDMLLEDHQEILKNKQFNASICTRWWCWYLWRFFNE